LSGDVKLLSFKICRRFAELKYTYEQFSSVDVTENNVCPLNPKSFTGHSYKLSDVYAVKTCPRL